MTIIETNIQQVFCSDGSFNIRNSTQLYDVYAGIIIFFYLAVKSAYYLSM